MITRLYNLLRNFARSGRDLGQRMYYAKWCRRFGPLKVYSFLEYYNSGHIYVFVKLFNHQVLHINPVFTVGQHIVGFLHSTIARIASNAKPKYVCSVFTYHVFDFGPFSFLWNYAADWGETEFQVFGRYIIHTFHDSYAYFNGARPFSIATPLFDTALESEELEF